MSRTTFPLWRCPDCGQYAHTHDQGDRVLAAVTHEYGCPRADRAYAAWYAWITAEAYRKRGRPYDRRAISDGEQLFICPGCSAPASLVRADRHSRLTVRVHHDHGCGYIPRR